MALRPEDPSSGFQHSNVVAFINEKMARHTKGPEFYLENISLSWEEVEDKLRAILEDSEVPSEVKEACTWGSLALGVRFARRQAQLQRHRVRWLHGFAKLHKSAAQALASDLKELKAQQETERKEAASRLRMSQTSFVEVQKERDKVSWKHLLHAELASPHEWEQGAGGPGLATAGGVCTEGAGEEEEEAAVAAAGAAGGKGAEEEQRDVEAVAAPVEAMAPPVEAGSPPVEAMAAGKLHLLGAEGGRSQVGRNNHVLFLWNHEPLVQSLTRTSSCPAPCLIHILILKPFSLLLKHTHYIPSTSNSHSTSSDSAAFRLGGL
ncbi:testis-expressed protein 13A isoform X2 [Rhinopithecus roxellana]|uniref:testis-expressed protein 13A isoform X2 n=1 Tax=Rhinopithecus roxellana TaxID=61622 RepID=UPI001237216C|nr:testis-expressed protein 13A isoform X2 [Rhinopithecus roxellana]